MACGLPKAVREGKSNPCLSGKIQGSLKVLADFMVFLSLCQRYFYWERFVFLYKFPKLHNMELTGNADLLLLKFVLYSL